jgi:phosphoribosylamine--glycine ligase
LGVSGLGDVKTVLSSEFQKSEKCVVKLDDSSMCSVSFVAQNTKEMIEQVEHWEADGIIKTPWTGIVQRCAEGIEVSVEGWYGEGGWSNTNITIEEKKVWPGNTGPAVGCAYNTVAMISPKSRLFKMMVEPVGEILKKSGYMGQIDTNCIVGEDGPVALEFTPRPGYDATPTLAWGHEEGYADLVCKALGIENLDVSKSDCGPRGVFWSGVRVSIPPYPVECRDKSLCEKINELGLGVPVVIPPTSQNDFYLHDVHLSDDGKLVCAGTSGVIGVAMGGGDSPKTAGKAAYRVAEKLQIPNKQYRAIDGWHRAEVEIPELISDGWVKL